MYFKRLEMHGFKSFAEPAIIEFHEGVTCIVGPNGSGKSNISDAIRWVLGEQSPKMLRGGKMEEVIFSGTANRKSRGMAEVTLVIDNTTGILPIDYNEVAITRRMYRSGESEYLINNNQCRLRDIRELIMDTGIGVDGYSIIGQGKIAELVSNKPESRREIFEEAAGVVMYKTKKAESERKLASASANLERVNDIIAEIEGRIDTLKEDSIKAKEYIVLRDRFKELEINITLKNIEKFDEANQILSDDIKTLAEKLEKLTEEKHALDEKVAEGRQKKDHLEQLGSEARDRLVGIIEEINQLTNKSQLDAERLNTLDRDFARVTDEIAEIEEKKTREESNASGLEEQKRDILSKLRDADSNLQEKIELYNEVSTKYSNLSLDIDENRNQMYKLHNESSAKKSESRSMESFKESLEQRKTQLIEDSKRLGDSKVSSTAMLKKAEEDKQSVDEAIEALLKTITANNEKINNLTNKVNQLDKDINHVQLQVGQHQARKRTIEEMENNYEGYNTAVKFIMRNNLKGIEGVTTDLMEVPSGLEVAIETALGAGLQNVVCQKDQDAKVAVNALKENRAGRLTFLPIESVKGGVANIPSQIANEAGFKGLACNLVKYDSKYDGIFKYLLGRVAIVENMQDAIDFSKKTGAGVRFVTVEGEVVNASGAITGGKYKNASANLLERKSEITKLADKIAELEKKGQSLREERDNAVNEGRTLRTELQKSQEQEKTLQHQSINLKLQIENIKNAAEELESNELKFNQQLSNINKDYDSAVEMAAKLAKEAEECALKAEEVKANIELLNKQQEELKVDVDNASSEITAKRIEKNSW
ncbi:MAG: chromosome segregation protein SMC, partial [Firmicutes bacterium]|nr:chromosome segregation protein SMC [Bacillota bacterium]